jgi:hypothetical protein
MKTIFFMLALLVPPLGRFRVRPALAALSPLQANSRTHILSRTGTTENRCGARQFTPNYAVEAGVFQSVRWQRFPLAIWIDPSAVENSEEMSELRAGLSEWSEATGGVLGVTFVEKQYGAQIWVKMVDELPGANGRTRFAFTEGRIARLATIEIVHAHWSGAAAVKIKLRTVQRDAAHEMGHALGIVRHTTQPGTIMFRIPMTDAPSLLDVNTIKTKYCGLFDSATK